MHNMVKSLAGDSSDTYYVNYGMSIDGFDAQVVENEGGKPKIAVAFPHDKYIYTFQTDDNIENTLTQMLKTFQFGGPRTGLKRYVSKAMGFSLEIPERWDVNELETNQDGSYYNYRTINFRAPLDDKNLTPFDIYITHKDYKELFPDYIENYTISGIPAYRASPPPGMNAPYEVIVFRKGNDTYVIERFKFHTNEDTLNKILSSFRFN